MPLQANLEALMKSQPKRAAGYRQPFGGLVKVRAKPERKLARRFKDEGGYYSTSCVAGVFGKGGSYHRLPPCCRLNRNLVELDSSLTL